MLRGPVDGRNEAVVAVVGEGVEPVDDLLLRELGSGELEAGDELIGEDPTDRRDLDRLLADLLHLGEVRLDLGDLRFLLERHELRHHDRALEQIGVGCDQAGVVTVRQLLDRVEALLLQLLGEDDHLVDVHAGLDEVDALLLHLRDLGTEVRLGEPDRVVVEHDLGRRVLLEGVPDALRAQLGLVGDPVRQHADLGGAHLLCDVGNDLPGATEADRGRVGEDVVVSGHLRVDVPQERGLTGRVEGVGAAELQRRDERRERVVLGEARLHLLQVLEADDVVAFLRDLQLPAVDAAVFVDHVEVRVHAVGELGVLPVHRVRLRRDDRHLDLGVGDTGRVHRDVLGVVGLARRRRRRVPRGTAGIVVVVTGISTRSHGENQDRRDGYRSG